MLDVNTFAREQERVRVLSQTALVGAPVIKLPEHTFHRPRRNFTPYGTSVDLWNSTEHQVIFEGPAETGKSIALLNLLDHLCWTYPKLNAAIVRKVRADMGSTVLQTFEKKVLDMPDGKPSSGVYRHGGEHQEFYQYPNGSRIWVVGLDRPGKALSAEFDVVAVNQAEELEEGDWETLVTRTTGRAGVLTPGRLLGDCNPGPSVHWILSKGAAGGLRLIKSVHTNNPTLYDQKTGELTLQGKTTIAGLQSLTGVRRKRLYEGLWVAAEGIVYELFDKSFHVIADPISKIRRRVAGVDWGYKNPGVIQVWGLDGDNRMYREHEEYRTGKLVAASLKDDAWWVNTATELHARFEIEAFVCDPSEPQYIKAFRMAGLNAVPAFNSISLGIQNLESRLVKQKDNYARLYLLTGSKGAMDEELLKKRQPTCFEEEIEVYVWQKDTSGKPKKKEVPVDENNHGCDAARYACAFVDKLGNTNQLPPSVNLFSAEQDNEWRLG